MRNPVYLRITTTRLALDGVLQHICQKARKRCFPRYSHLTVVIHEKATVRGLMESQLMGGKSRETVKTREMFIL